MKNIFLSALVFGSTAQGGQNLIITIQSPTTPKDSITLLLKKEDNKFFCHTEDVPEHEVVVEGLDVTAAPFKSQKLIDSACARIITWGRQRQCYRYGEVHLIDDLIRKCSNI